MAPYNPSHGWLPSRRAVYKAFLKELWDSADQQSEWFVPIKQEVEDAVNSVASEAEAIEKVATKAAAAAKLASEAAKDAAAAKDAEEAEDAEVIANDTAKAAKVAADKAAAAAVYKFGETIKRSPLMFELFKGIFRQATQTIERKISSLDDFLNLLLPIVSSAPKFQSLKGAEGEPIGVPMYILFNEISNTVAAYDLFRMKEFNVALKNLLDYWGGYLTTIASASTLNPQNDGWLSDKALTIMDGGRGSFKTTYQIDENHPTLGFNSWDEFFVRKFQKDVRRISIPPGANRKRLIFNPCESTAERWRVGVKDHDRFWLKGMPYSLYDIFRNPDAQEDHVYNPGTHEYAEATAKTFNGGTIYQAFLSPQDYHRWHSPIDGQIKAAYIIPGTYYAVLPDEGRYDDEIEPGGAIIRCQPWLTVAATRAVFVITGEHVGDVGFVAIGMVEVSTCEITVKVGQSVEAGDELGMFHFGGSSHALIFNPEAQIKLNTEQVIKKQRHIHLKKVIGTSVKV